MRTNVHCYHGIALDIKNSTQVTFDINGMDCPAKVR